MSNFKTLNLAYPENSDIEFKFSKYPDGQQGIEIFQGSTIYQETDIKIYSRIRSFRDLELIIAANQHFREVGARSVSLYVPYMLGARSDRKFNGASVNYVKKVIAPIINAQKFDCVLVLDPHSDVLEACFDNFEKIDNHLVVKSAIEDLSTSESNDDIILVSPDGGALKKIYDVASAFKINNIITAMKHRDIATGKITHTDVPISDNIEANLMYYQGCKFVIVDDICDGGRTFIELAKAIKNRVPNAKIYLVVTHGIFSSGFDKLGELFEKIYTTNSYADVTVGEPNDENMCGYFTHTWDGFAQSGSISKADLLLQLNIF